MVLAIGGLDPSGGAGITLDARAIQLAGCHPATVACLLTNQTGNRFLNTTPLDGRATLTTARLILDDLFVRAIKVGALGNLDNTLAVDQIASTRSDIPFVLDPVLESSSGGRLLEEDALTFLKETLLRRGVITTPNLREAEILSDMSIQQEGDLPKAGKRILGLGAKAVLIKGGHMQGERCIDLLMDDCGNHIFFGNTRIGETDVRGTGCALASLIAGGLAQGHPLPRAVSMARNMVRFAIKLCSNVGSGVHVLELT